MFALIPVNVFAIGEDKTSTVEVNAITNDEIVNVGNINITTKYGSSNAYGIRAVAANNYDAIVTAKDITVNVDDYNVDYQIGVDAWDDGSAGNINITTKNITSKCNGLTAVGRYGGQISILTNGDVNAKAFSGLCDGTGVTAQYDINSKVNIIVNGYVFASKSGLLVIASGNDTGAVNVTVGGNVEANNGTGLLFDGATNKADVLVSGIIYGSQQGVCTDTYYWEKKGSNKLTVWALASNGNLVTKRTGPNEYVPDDDFAKEINYIIKHEANVLPRKTDGSSLDKSHNLPVAREGDRVIIDTALDGVRVKKAFNGGVEIKTKDQYGNFYIDVKRGGGIDLSIETEVVQDLCPADPSKLEPGICGCGIPDVDTDGDGFADCVDVCPNDPLNNEVYPVGGCFVNGSNIPEKYDPKVKVPAGYIATPKTKPLPPFVIHKGKSADVYFERYAGGVIKIGDKLGKAKYEVRVKTKNKKGLSTKKMMQALSKNKKSIKLKKGDTVTLQYRMVITKKSGKKTITKNTSWSKSIKLKFKQLM